MHASVAIIVAQRSKLRSAKRHLGGDAASTARRALSLYAKARYHCSLKAMETTREKATYENHHRRMGW
jgi:hypothetical protein